jgi:hypothetical protein
MNSYEREQAARRARFEARAETAAKASAMAYSQAHSMAEAIPFGQPILIGHHSEKRDRAYRGKIHSRFGQAFGLADKAKHYEQKAAAVGTGVFPQMILTPSASCATSWRRSMRCIPR